jgi:hypothetical protein
MVQEMASTENIAEETNYPLDNGYNGVQQSFIQDDLGDEEFLPFEYSITSYGIDFDVKGLIGRMQDEDIVIPAFQRNYVWSRSRASQLVESFLLGLPIPGIFLYKEDESEKLLVIDGQQRLKSLRLFYEGSLILTGVQEQYLGKTYDSLDAVQRRKLDSSIIHATVVKQERPTDDDSSIYFLFRRLNTNAMPLRPQEIRSAFYFGKLNDLLETLNQNLQWRSLVSGRRLQRLNQPDNRKRDHELILRFFALYYQGDKYQSPMEKFLNTYMAHNRNLERQDEMTLTDVFNKTVDVIYSSIEEKAFRFTSSSLNAALYDALMVGIARRLEKGEITDLEAVERSYTKLVSLPAFAKAVTASTASEVNVKTRLDLSISAFAIVE